MKKWYVFLLLAFANFSLFSQNKSVVDNAGIDLKIFNGNQAFYAGDINKALKLYMEANIARPNNGPILFHIGQCHYVNQETDEAIQYLEKSEMVDTAADDDVHLVLGLAYQQEDKLEKAKAEFIWHRRQYSNDPKKLKGDEINHLIAECTIAERLESHPINVKVRNAGQNINTDANEKSSSVSADGATLIFTSDRPYFSMIEKPAPPNKKQVPALTQPFDNVYICKWDSNKKEWGRSYPIDGDVNELFVHTSCTSISPDGNDIFLYKNSSHGAYVGGDIYMSAKTKKGKWTTPVSLGKPVNSSYYEDGACLSPDENCIYFTSERPGGYGSADIYKADKGADGQWGAPENLGAGVNTDDNEGSPFMAPDGHTLFFSSNGHGTMGGYDIFKSAMNDSSGKWSEAANLGYPINSVNNEKSFSLSADTRTAYFSSDRKGGLGGRDIYMADLSNYSVLDNDHADSKPKGFSILRGKITNSHKVALKEAEVIVSDSAGKKIFTLHSNADGMYFITLKANNKYKVAVSLTGYKTATKPFLMPDSPVGTYTMEQNIALVKN